MQRAQRAGWRGFRRHVGWAALGWLSVLVVLAFGAMIGPAGAMRPQHAPSAGTLATARAELQPLLHRGPWVDVDPPLRNWRLVHGAFEWIMRDLATAWCCDQRDCFEVDDTQVHQVNGVWHVNGRPVSPHAVYPSQHKNMSFVVCFRADGVPRCLFLPGVAGGPGVQPAVRELA